MPFNAQPELAGPLLRLRPLVEADFPALFAVASDPLIWEQHPDKTRCQPEGFRRFFNEGLASGGALLALDRASGEVIGSSRYHGYDPAASEVEIGWTFLARRCWGGLYNWEMKRLMLDHAFAAVERVVFMIAADNFRSQRAVLKLGAVPAGSRTDGSGRTSLVFALTRDTWARVVAARGPGS